MRTLKLFLLIFINVVSIIADTIYRVDDETSVRKSASSSSPIIGTLKKDDYIYATGVTSGWAKFYMGYCRTQNLKKVTVSPNYKTTASINFRTGPGVNYNIVKSLTSDTTVTYYARDPFTSDWGVTDNGYCNMNYLTPKSAPTSSSTQPTVNNNVIENYTTLIKQYNYPKEYAAGCTIKKYGSCITSVTMALNRVYRKNYTPYDIAKKMTFNQCGAYHSSFTNLGFTIVNEPSLEMIMNALRAGRIVPFGTKNSKGNQHWVAVYGYIGDFKTLDSSDFLIYDPSYSRTRLSEHLSAFPIPYMALIYN